MPPDIETQIANVLAGKTADGIPYAKPIAFPAEGDRRNLLMRWADAFPLAADHVRTAFIRKLAHYLIKLASAPQSSFEVHAATVWFIDHPEHVCSPLSFAGALRRAQEKFARECNAAEMKAQEAMRRAMTEPMPPPPVLFDDGEHALHEIVHPNQMTMTGLAAMNCLARGHGGKHRCNVRYWSLISRKLLRIFALWENTRLLCVFSVSDDLIREWQYVAPPDEVIAIIPACLAALTRDTGPLNADHTLILFAGTCLDRHQSGSAAIRRALGGDHEWR